MLHIPTDFGRDLMRGERPSVLLEADATDPAATGSALSRDHGDQPSAPSTTT